MISTGTQTEQHHFSNDHAPVDLDKSFESLATTTSEASEWTPPEIDENNNLDNQRPHQVTAAENSLFLRNVWISFSSFVPSVGENVRFIQKNVVGTMLVVSRVCVCGEAFTWESQSLTGSIPTGNLVLSAAILFSGCSIKQIWSCFSTPMYPVSLRELSTIFSNITLFQLWKGFGKLTKMPYLI